MGGLRRCRMAPCPPCLVSGLSATSPRAAWGGAGSSGWVPGTLGCSGEEEASGGGSGWGGQDRPTHPAGRRTLATLSPCEATSLMTGASSASTVGTSSSWCQWPIWSQVSPRAGWAPTQGGRHVAEPLASRGAEGVRRHPRMPSRLAVWLRRGPFRTLPCQHGAACCCSRLCLLAGAEDGPAQGPAAAQRARAGSVGRRAGGEEDGRGGSQA